MTFFCFLINLLLTDYYMHSFWQGKGANAIALNAAIFSAVILASRLKSNIHVFGLVSFAFNWFALLPILRRSLKVLRLGTKSYLTVGVFSFNLSFITHIWTFWSLPGFTLEHECQNLPKLCCCNVHSYFYTTSLLSISSKIQKVYFLIISFFKFIVKSTDLGMKLY